MLNTNVDVNALVATITQAVLLALNTPAEVTPERKEVRKVLKAKIVKNADNAQARKIARKTPVADAMGLPIDVLVNRACAEVAANTTGPNSKRISLCDNDLRAFITRPTNAALKAYARENADVTITQISETLVRTYEKANGKNAARKVWAAWA